MSAPRRVTKKHPDECSQCEGFGDTPETQREMAKTTKGKLFTTYMGSGCPKCHGTGRLADKITALRTAIGDPNMRVRQAS